jgi:hypothetical protein
VRRGRKATGLSEDEAAGLPKGDHNDTIPNFTSLRSTPLEVLWVSPTFQDPTLKTGQAKRLAAKDSGERGTRI